MNTYVEKNGYRSRGVLVLLKSQVNSARAGRSSTKTTRGTASNNASANTNASKSARVSSPRGVIQITSHILRKHTPEEKRGKKFRCEAAGCSFIGYSRGAISTHYANSDDHSHPPLLL